ncbi:MAG: aminotransferase class V-fold PLP-dependent enzyme [Candidatus Omnitrophica bacterium]|nr:aminotransferase class V-fold PLP-dependent enzyme [Candidatus Omnitrophota bacterium]
MPNWDSIRKIDFPITQKFTYLDHAAGGVVSRPAFQAANEFWKQALREGDFRWIEWLERKEVARRQIAAFINAEPEEIAFVPNTSEGMNLIAELFDSKAEVIASDMEFPASTIPFLYRKFPVRFLKARGNKTLPEDFRKALRPKTKIIISSYVQYASGFRQNIRELSRVAKRHGAVLVVNASQALGAFPIDVKALGIDCLAANSYKWMLAGYGGGIVFVRKGLLRKRKPRFAGWRSVNEPDCYDNRRIDVKSEASRYEYGGPAFPNFFALGTACDYLTSIGKEAIAKRILSLTDYLVDELRAHSIPVLSPLEPEFRSGIVIAKVQNPAETSKKLFRHKIFAIPRGEGLRIAPHFYNNESDVDRLIRFLRKG